MSVTCGVAQLTPGSGFLQLYPTATTAEKWTVFHLSETLGEQAWRESGLRAPAVIDTLNHTITRLEQTSQPRTSILP